MTAAKPTGSEHATANDAVDFHRFASVLGTTGREAALPRRAEQPLQHGGKRPLINAQEKNDGLAGQVHSVFNNPLLRSIA
jgi:hypothetical protein